MTRMYSFSAVIAAASLMAACSSGDSDEFAGRWNVTDTKGNPFEITLGADGSAKADREGEGMNGTWKREGDSAVISWTSGWTTKIAKEGGKYTKVATEKGQTTPSAGTTAEKVN